MADNRTADISHSFIIVKGKPKALQIECIDLSERGLYVIKYRNSPKRFHYRYNDVVWIKESKWHDHLNCKVFINGREEHNVSDIRSFQQYDLTHWRISFSNGFVQDYMDGSICVAESCLNDEVAKNVYEYLKRIAFVNELGKDEEHGGILPSLYKQINFIDRATAIAPYLLPDKYKIREYQTNDLIFPFGCNASQEKAIRGAFEKQISIIQGPPGTGKTQTILNIIANIVAQDKSVIVVANNNSATANVLDKLKKYELDFIVASLGKRDNKEAFIKNQPVIPQNLPSWRIPLNEKAKMKNELSANISKLKSLFALKEELSSYEQECAAVKIEWQHFITDNQIDENDYTPKRRIKSQQLMKLWLQYQVLTEYDIVSAKSFFYRLKKSIKWIWLNLTQKQLLGSRLLFDYRHLEKTILRLQALYYNVRISELTSRIMEIKKELKIYHYKDLYKNITSTSFCLLKDALYKKYHKKQPLILTDVKEIGLYAEDLSKRYPVILSTAFSACIAIPNQTYDYLIMDEASQVSIDTGALALTCAKNAVIVGDSMQLPNIVTNEDRIKLNSIFEKYKVAQGYHCANYSFLQSLCSILPNVQQTLLREHYRCHPTIINFCNQRFYGGNLRIMTKDEGEKDVMMVIKTVPSHHMRDHYNQREIDVVRDEVLPKLGANEDIGIITPYNHQVNEFIKQLPNIETATIHKYQGREKDVIIMSVVDDQITEFCDDSNLINVAISRAKNDFALLFQETNKNGKATSTN